MLVVLAAYGVGITGICVLNRFRRVYRLARIVFTPAYVSVLFSASFGMWAFDNLCNAGGSGSGRGLILGSWVLIRGNEFGALTLDGRWGIGMLVFSVIAIPLIIAALRVLRHPDAAGYFHR